MANKTIFSIDGSKFSNLFSNLFKYLKETRIKLITKEDKTKINIPLYLGLIIGILFPVLTVIAIIVALVTNHNITIDYEAKTNNILIEDKN